MQRESSATKKICAFWNPQTNSGCRKGAACEFLHSSSGVGSAPRTTASAPRAPERSAWSKTGVIHYQSSSSSSRPPSANVPIAIGPQNSAPDIEKMYLEKVGVCKLTADDYRRLVVHCRHSPYDVYIGRKNPSIPNSNFKWGNPFKMEQESDRFESRDKVTRQYELYVLSNPQLIAEAKRELKGKVLACWCAPKQCHGLVLCRVANSE